MYQLDDNVVYVKGAKRGAIYDFISRKVFWINDEACTLLDKLVRNNSSISSLTATEQNYIDLLEDNNLWNNDYGIKEYMPQIEKSQTIEMAWLEITQKCNCRCLHCYQGEEHKQSVNILTLEDWKETIIELEKIGVSRVVVIGGEPCCHKYVYDILEELYNKGINTTLFTNATMLSPKLKKLLVHGKDKISLKVSLYADNKATHDMITQHPGSFNKLVHNVRELTELGVTVNIAVVAMKENQDELSGIKDFIHSLGANYSKFDVIRNVFGGKQSQHTPTNADVIDSCMFCEPNFKTNKQLFDNNYYKNSCWYGKIAITETGDVLPCVFERNMILGNVRQHSIEEILQSEILNKCWYMDFRKIEYCKDCEFRFSCKDCRPLGFSVEGKMTTKNPRCKYNPYKGEWRTNDEFTKK